MVKAITFPLSITYITDHEPYWKQGETVKLTINTDGEVRHEVDLTVAYVGQSHPIPRHEYFLWCRDTGERECSIDVRAFFFCGIAPEELERSVARLEAKPPIQL